MSDTLNAMHISTNLDNYESARSGFFTLLIGSGETWNKEDDTKLDTINGIPTAHNRSATVVDLDGNTQQKILALNVTKAFVPHFELNVLEYKRGNETVKFAGTPTFQGGDLTVDDIVGVDTKSILLAWQAQAYDVHTGKGGRMKHYKKTCKLMEYTQDYELIREWELRGCWIKSLSEDPFDKENDGKRQISVSIEYDKAIPINAKYGQYGTRDAL
ncbi:MAG: hypothetical protein J6A25_00395 [Lachnospiraceae bacterium]|nr:hypothetical protein [Lachnospiraceae bacterium]